MRIEFVRLTRIVSRGLVGARQEAQRKLTGKEPAPHKDEYVYLQVRSRHSEKMEGQDLLSLKTRWFKRTSAHWIEFAPERATKLIDSWGWGDLTVLTDEEVYQVLKARDQELFDAYIAAQEAWVEYSRTKTKMFGFIDPRPQRKKA